MGVVVNPRGTSGAGKTELARRILAEYGWREEGRAEPILRAGRRWPLGYRLRHPRGGPPLVVLGHYERTSGGCDTLPARDGGLGEAFRLADAWASAGHDVLLEGSALSAEHAGSAALARRHRLHILRLATPPDQAARNLAARRHARRGSWPLLAGAVLAQDRAVAEACRRLGHLAAIEVLDFAAALHRSRELLGTLPREDAAGPLALPAAPAWRAR